jgi:uncharacterized damage-inducible protein DinB
MATRAPFGVSSRRMRTDQARLLAEYNAWMNDKLYAACATLSDDERKRDCGAFFRSIHGTLNHLLVADSIWMGRFESQPFAFKSLDEELCASFDELRVHRADMDRRISQWAGNLTDAALDAKLEFASRITKRTHAPTLWRIVLHFFNHQTHHRGQLTTLLSQAGIDYGTTDLFLMPAFLDG